MTATALLSILLLQAASATEGEIRSVSVVVTDDKGDPVAGLVPEEVALVENGVARDVARVEQDKRALTVILLVDTSQAMAPSSG